MNVLRTATLCGLAWVCVGLTAGCYSAKGGFMPYTNGPETYLSYETLPVSLELVDLRNGETIFAMDVPAGKQLTLRFYPGDGDDEVYTPDLMKYHVFDFGESSGRLESSITVPPANARRLDVHYRQGREYSPADGAQPTRAGQLDDVPDWWTPQGGPPPEEHTAVTLYDD